jgi:hypothetical protein
VAKVKEGLAEGRAAIYIGQDGVTFQPVLVTRKQSDTDDSDSVRGLPGVDVITPGGRGFKPLVLLSGVMLKDDMLLSTILKTFLNPEEQKEQGIPRYVEDQAISIKTGTHIAAVT